MLFRSAGGGEYYYIPALNENDAWIHAMTEIALENLQVWVSADWDSAQAAKDNQLTLTRAQSLGALQ